jgi:hypothetical protein
MKINRKTLVAVIGTVTVTSLILVAVLIHARVSAASEVAYVGATRPEPQNLTEHRKGVLQDCRAEIERHLGDDFRAAEQRGDAVTVAVNPTFLLETYSDRQMADFVVRCYYADAGDDNSISVTYLDPYTNKAFGRHLKGKELSFDR